MDKKQGDTMLHSETRYLKTDTIKWGELTYFNRENFYYSAVSTLDYVQEENEALVIVLREIAGYFPFFLQVLNRMSVRVSEQDSSKISYFPDRERQDKRIRVIIKPGKFLKKIAPWVSEKEVESFVVWFQNQNNSPDYEIVIGNTREDFKKAYESKVISRPSPCLRERSGYGLSSLSSSCMQKESYNWETEGLHPCEVYGSGDFQIVYVTEKITKLIGARVIIGNNSTSNVYTSCDIATRHLIKYLKENDVSHRPRFDGLSLCKIKIGDGDILMAYVDDYCEGEDCGDYIEIGGSGVSVQTTKGKTSCVPMGFCGECEESTDELELREALDRREGEICICAYCRDRYYTWSNLMDTYIHDSNIVEDIGGDIATITYFDENNYVLDVNDNYCIARDCVYHESEYYYKSDDSVVEKEGFLYHIESDDYQKYLDKKAKKDQSYQTTITYNWGWVLVNDADNRYPQAVPILKHIETKETTLRYNYQLDSKGIPQRLPELNFA